MLALDAGKLAEGHQTWAGDEGAQEEDRGEEHERQS